MASNIPISGERTGHERQWLGNDRFSPTLAVVNAPTTCRLQTLPTPAQPEVCLAVNSGPTSDLVSKPSIKICAKKQLVFCKLFFPCAVNKIIMFH